MSSRSKTTVFGQIGGDNEIETDENREEIIRSVMQDYFKFEETAVNNGTQFKSAKSPPNFTEQNYTSHVRNGVQFILQLYRVLPTESGFTDEDTLRESVALFCAHDYHKLRDRTSEEFDITMEEAESYIDSYNLDTIFPDISVETVQAVMMGHHMTHDDARRGGITRDTLDVLYPVLLADSIASTESLVDTDLSTVRERLGATLTTDYNVRTHTVDTNGKPIVSMRIQSAIAETISDESDWKPLRIYEDGVLYLTGPDSDEYAPTEGTASAIFENFIEALKSVHSSHGLTGIEGGALDLGDTYNRVYDTNPRDVLYHGLDGSIERIIRKSVADAARNDDPPKSTMVDVIDDKIQPYVDTEINTETRHIEGLSRGVHTIRKYLLSHLVDEDGNGPEWQTDMLVGALYVFGVQTPERIKEVKKLREESTNLATKHTVWQYKYLIAQYVYDDYYVSGNTDSTNPQEFADEIVDIVTDALEKYDGYDELEELFVGRERSELCGYLLQNVTVDGQKLSRLVDAFNYEPVQKYFHEGKESCDVCGFGTLETGQYRLLKQEELSRAEGVLNYGNGQTRFELKDKSPVCFACQLEVGIRDSYCDDWGDDKVYMVYETEYGYTPLSWGMAESLRDVAIDPNSNNLALRPLLEAYSQDEFPDIVEDIVESDSSQVQDMLNYHDGGFHPQTGFPSTAPPICDTMDEESLISAISAASLISSYTGVRMRLTRTPFTNERDDTSALVHIEDGIADGLPFVSDEIHLHDVQGIVEKTALTTSIPADSDESALHDVMNGTERLYPASRRLMEESKLSKQAFTDAAIKLDAEIGQEYRQMTDLIQSAHTLGSMCSKSARMVVQDAVLYLYKNLGWKMDESEIVQGVRGQYDYGNTFEEQVVQDFAEEVARLVDSTDSEKDAFHQYAMDVLNAVAVRELHMTADQRGDTQ